MKRAQKLPVALRGRAFNTRVGFAGGVTAKRLRGGDLERPFVGIRVPRGSDLPDPWVVDAYSRRMSADDFFSHVSAAQIHGLPLPTWLARARTVHVSTECQEQRDRLRGVVGHHVRGGSIRTVVVRGLRVTSPVDTWCQLSTVLAVDDLIKIGDALVRRKLPLATMLELRVGVARYAGRRGVRNLREALDSVRPGVDSPKETEVRLLLVRARLPEPEVNGDIVDRAGLKIATGDLVYRKYRVLVEYDGEQHRNDADQYHWDVDRLDALMEADWRVVRINKSHLRYRPATVIRKVETALRTRGWRP
jgi:hypothetical protein